MNPRDAVMIVGGTLRTVRRILTALGDAGAAAVEFAIFVPAFMIILGGTIDLGYLTYTASALTAAVSAGSQYAENNAAMVASNPSGLATSVSTAVANASGPNWATSVVNVNNNTTNCYCPSGSPGNWTWGAAVACGNACPSGGFAGQFVTITASRTVSPLFPSYGLVFNDTLSRSAIVETQ
jgi:Flp pilus assembly protein TadG